MTYKPYPAYKYSGIEWLGAVPKNWLVTLLKRIAVLKYGEPLLSEDRDNGDICVFGSNGIVGNHSISNTEGMTIVIGRKGSFGKINLSSHSCYAIDTTFFVDHRHTNCDLKWLFYLLFSLELDSFSKDSAVPGLSREDVYKRQILVPSLSEQQIIAAFLDERISFIDTLIEKKQRQIELLQEKRSALITHTVIKGLNPDAPMKDSGVEWLGGVPELWKISKLKHLGKAQIGLTYSPADLVEEGEGTIVLRASNIQNGNIVLEDNVFVQTDVPPHLFTKKGDILICSRSGSCALIGKCGMVDENTSGMSFGVFMSVFRSLYHNYLFFVFNSSCFECQLSECLTSTINQLTLENLRNMKVPFPSPEEQEKIVTVLSESITQIDNLITKTHHSIELLHEYRSALITAAVTGKIDVRESVA